MITGVARRRRFSTDLKLAKTMQPGTSISYVAPQPGLSRSLVFRWRRLMSQGGKEAVRADDELGGGREFRRLEERVRKLERSAGPQDYGGRTAQRGARSGAEKTDVAVALTAARRAETRAAGA